MRPRPWMLCVPNRMGFALIYTLGNVHLIRVTDSPADIYGRLWRMHLLKHTIQDLPKGHIYYSCWRGIYVPYANQSIPMSNAVIMWVICILRSGLLAFIRFYRSQLLAQWKLSASKVQGSLIIWQGCDYSHNTCMGWQLRETPLRGPAE